MNPITKQQEIQHLSNILEKLKKEKQVIDDQVNEYKTEEKRAKTHFWDSLSEMDGAEKRFNRALIDNTVAFGEEIYKRGLRIGKLMDSPYFGRLDFQRTKDQRPKPYYIGIHSFMDENTHESLIFDWRAPISGMFYDFEPGQAHYESLQGKVEGTISLKRQYQIKNGVLEYMADSKVSVRDEILQKELSHNTDEKMKNIVATIQREQNTVIRNQDSRVLLIQGAAGSGKTSIALHRVAFLLYRFKDELTSRDILIISPNRVFADYISNVLPELGEEQIMETDMTQIAQMVLGKKIKFETYGQQVNELLEKQDEKRIQRMEHKSSKEWMTQLDEYIQNIEQTQFIPSNLEYKGIRLTRRELLARFKDFAHLPIFSRVDKVASDGAVWVKNRMKYEDGVWKNTDAKIIKEKIKAMFPYNDAMEIYQGFFEKNQISHLFVQKRKNHLEYNDLFGYLYTKLCTEGQPKVPKIKHLLVDEMQDYTPIEYGVLQKLFPCKMTILGDAFQSTNPYSSSSLDKIKFVFPQADWVELNKSYRSTVEITEFAQQIRKNPNLEPIQRHGESPKIIQSTDEKKEWLTIMDAFVRSDHKTLGVICKTQKQAKHFYEFCQQEKIDCWLLDEDSEKFHDGIVVTSARLAKGLEFDWVLIPQVDEKNYHNEMDQSILYIACTRAMHDLYLTYSKNLSPWIQPQMTY